MIPSKFADPNAPFDADASGKAIGGAISSLIKLSFPTPGAELDPDAAAAFMTTITEALAAAGHALAEVKRIRGALTAMRDGHRPRPHTDPTAPGALCDACSLHGALITWPCTPWTAAEQILTHNQR